MSESTTQTEELRELLAEFGLERHEQVLIDAMKPSLQGSLQRGTTEGNSRLGGRPDLPANMPWPTSGGTALTFLMQLDLASVAQFDVAKSLPSTGMLAVFYALKNQPWSGPNGVVVTHVTGDLHSREAPEGVEEVPATALRFTAEARLPGYLHPDFPLSDDHEDANELRDLYMDLDLNLSQLHLLGAAVACQTGDPVARIAGQFDEAVEDWTLLAEIGTFDGPGIYMGEDGGLFIAIRKADLAQGRFDRVGFRLVSH